MAASTSADARPPHPPFGAALEIEDRRSEHAHVNDRVNERDDDSADDVAGRQLGRYTLVRRLGKGGMGEVFLAKAGNAKAGRSLEKLVAIKRILPQYASNTHVVNMLIDEARICAHLNHPNVVHVHELDEEDDDAALGRKSVFIVMEYVDGFALSRLVRRIRKRGERMDPLLACFVLTQVLDGLHAAHTQRDEHGELLGIIHRDVSPQNVLLSMTGQVKVIDFGIARARDRLEATQGNQVKGKLRYMAPEQIKPSLAGSSGIDARVDVFAAGIVLFELLAMRQRYAQQGDLEIIDAILEEDPPDLRREGLIDGELHAILQQALARERKRRFKDAGAFAAALRGYLHARDPSFNAEKLQRAMRRIFLDDEGATEPPPSDVSDAVDDVPQSVRVRRVAADEETPVPARPAPAPIVKKGKVKELPIKKPDADVEEIEEVEEVTRTQLRPRLIEPPPPPPKKKKSLVPAPVLGAVLGIAILVGGGWFVRQAMQPQQLPVDGTPVTAAPTPETPAAPETPSTKTGGFVDLGGAQDMIVEVDPPTAQISLTYRPDPKYVSPARLKVQRGETVELSFEAEGYEPAQRRFIAEGDLHFAVKLVPIPIPLVIRPVPRDAEVLVNGAAWSGGKVLPGDAIAVSVRHPFFAEKTVNVVAKPAEPLILDITLDQPPPAPVVVDAGPDDLDRAIDTGKKLAKKQKLTQTGVLIVTSKPPYAEVFVDGKKLYTTTPVRETLPVGTHKVTVRGKGAEKTFLVEISAGTSLKKEITLE